MITLLETVCTNFWSWLGFVIILSILLKYIDNTIVNILRSTLTAILAKIGVDDIDKDNNDENND